MKDIKFIGQLFDFFINCLLFICSGMVFSSKNGNCSGVMIQIMLKRDHYLNTSSQA